MFPYDATLAAAASVTPQTIPGVLQLMQTIDGTCVDADGLKWFNWLYYQVTKAVETRVSAGGFNDTAWLAELDVQFAGLYFSALRNALSGVQCPGCWGAMFSVRNQTGIARIQFAFAGMNAHINHDLALALIATCQARNTAPRHGTPQYDDYTAINATLDTLIDTAKQTLNVRLLGGPLPPVAHVENLIAAWDMAAAREHAWNTAECLWTASPPIRLVQMASIDGLTAVIGKTLLIPAP